MTISLTPDQALVLGNWLHEVMMKSDRLRGIVTDQAVWSPLYAISGTIETTSTDIFSPDYGDRLNAARHRLLEAMGDLDGPRSAHPER